MYSRRCEKKGWIETSAGRDVAIIWGWVLRAHRSQSQQMMGNDGSDGKEARQLWLLDVATGKLAVKVLTVIQFSVYPRNIRFVSTSRWISRRTDCTNRTSSSLCWQGKRNYTKTCDLPRDSEALLKINHKSKDGRSQTFSQI